MLNTGDGCAILDYRGFAFHAGWCWRLKDRIDRRFIAMHQDYTPGVMTSPASDETMQCAGCGGKLAADVLAEALARLEIMPSPRVRTGLNPPDDVAIVELAIGQSIAATVDFFAPFCDDPYLVGRGAALNAASDLLAKGLRPAAALAIVAAPPGATVQQAQWLHEQLAGAQREFQRMNVDLAGGHTIERPQLLIGFSLLAADNGHPMLKSGLSPGDLLVITKPLGVGILLAAHRRALCRAPWHAALWRALLTSNEAAASAARPGKPACGQPRMSPDLDLPGICSRCCGLVGFLPRFGSIDFRCCLERANCSPSG